MDNSEILTAMAWKWKIWNVNPFSELWIYTSFRSYFKEKCFEYITESWLSVAKFWQCSLGNLGDCNNIAASHALRYTLDVMAHITVSLFTRDIFHWDLQIIHKNVIS